MTYLFVYGTLLNSQKNSFANFLSTHSEYYDSGYFQGLLFDVGEYPAAIISTNVNDIVFGEIYRIKNPEFVLSSLDEYEEVGSKYTNPNEYYRTKLNVYTKTLNIELSAWIYLYNHNISNLKPIKSGNYSEYCKKLKK